LRRYIDATDVALKNYLIPPSWLGWSLLHYCDTDNQRYVLFVVVTIMFVFPLLYLSSNMNYHWICNITRLVHLVEQELLTLPG